MNNNAENIEIENKWDFGWIFTYILHSFLDEGSKLQLYMIKLWIIML